MNREGGLERSANATLVRNLSGPMYLAGIVAMPSDSEDRLYQGRVYTADGYGPSTAELGQERAAVTSYCANGRMVGGRCGVRS